MDPIIQIGGVASNPVTGTYVTAIISMVRTREVGNKRGGSQGIV